MCEKKKPSVISAGVGSVPSSVRAGRRVVDVTPGCWMCHAWHSPPGPALPVPSHEQLAQPDLQHPGSYTIPHSPPASSHANLAKKEEKKTPFTRNPLGAGQKLFSVNVPRAFAKVCRVNYGAERVGAPTCAQIICIFLSLWTTTHWWEKIQQVNTERTWTFRKAGFY